MSRPRRRPQPQLSTIVELLLAEVDYWRIRAERLADAGDQVLEAWAYHDDSPPALDDACADLAEEIDAVPALLLPPARAIAA